MNEKNLVFPLQEDVRAQPFHQNQLERDLEGVVVVVVVQMVQVNTERVAVLLGGE